MKQQDAHLQELQPVLCRIGNHAKKTLTQQIESEGVTTTVTCSVAEGASVRVEGGLEALARYLVKMLNMERVAASISIERWTSGNGLNIYFTDLRHVNSLAPPGGFKMSYG